MFAQLGCGGSVGRILDAPQLVGGGDDPNRTPFREWAIQVCVCVCV